MQNTDPDNETAGQLHATGENLRFERLTTLTDDDARTLQRLAQQLTPDCSFNVRELVGCMRNSTISIFALRLGPHIVASATAARFSTPTGKHCFIEDVVVDKQCRGQGLGRRIMRNAIDALVDDGVNSIELTSRPSRIAANALYQSLGFVRRQTNVYKLAIRSADLKDRD